MKLSLFSLAVASASRNSKTAHGATLPAMLGVPSVASQESASLSGTDFPEQAAQAINKTSDETSCNCGMQDGQFCGDDGRCHLYSCQTWYEFGPTEFTGNHHKNTSSASGLLDCQNISITEPSDKRSALADGSVYYPSVSLQCASLTPPLIAMGFNRHCSVKTGVHGTGEFNCYELAELTDFKPFLDEADSAKLGCLDNETDVAGGWPKFTYRATAELFISTDDQVDMHEAFDGTNGTNVFNETLALTGTIYARLDEMLTDPPTAGPTKAPTAAAPNQTTNAALLAVIFLITSLIDLS